MNKLETRSESVERNEGTRKAAIGGLVGGISMMGVAVLGLAHYEAETPQDAIGSVAFADRTYYVMEEEIPFFGLGAIGAIGAISAAEYLRRPEEE